MMLSLSKSEKIRKYNYDLSKSLTKNLINKNLFSGYLASKINISNIDNLKSLQTKFKLLKEIRIPHVNLELGSLIRNLNQYQRIKKKIPSQNDITNNYGDFSNTLESKNVVDTSSIGLKDTFSVLEAARGNKDIAGFSFPKIVNNGKFHTDFLDIQKYVKNKFEQGFKDSNLENRVIQKWVNLGLPVKIIKLEDNNIKIPIECILNFSINSELNIMIPLVDTSFACLNTVSASKDTRISIDSLCDRICLFDTLTVK